MRTDRYRPNQPPYLLYGLLLASLGMNVYLVTRDGGGAAAAGSAGGPVLAAGPGAAAASAMGGGAVGGGVAVVGSESGPGAVGAAAGPGAGVAAGGPGGGGAAEAGVEGVGAPLLGRSAADPLAASGAAGPPAGALPGGWRVLRAEVRHSLARTFQRALPAEAPADALAAVASRLLMWDLDLRRDLQAGDRIAVVWRVDEDGEIEIPALRYRSGKLGRTLEAYAFQAPGDRWTSWWDAEGREVPRRLVQGPLEAYEQVTSLLRDRPRHHGMDFKVPVGTPVHAPKAGTVTRVDWNVRANGRCVELRYADGTRAIFLHLESPSVRVGQHVPAGGVIGHSGNTGHSTAPHLHYQLQRGDRVVDPVDYHGTLRRELPASARAAYARARARWSDLLAEAVAEG